MKQIKENLINEEKKEFKKKKIDKKSLLIIISIITVIAISILVVKFWASKSNINLPFINQSLTPEFLSKKTNSNVAKIIDIRNINTNGYTELSLVELEDKRTYLYLSNLKEDKATYLNTPYTLVVYLGVSVQNNTYSKLMDYITDKINNDNSYTYFEAQTENINSAITDISKIIGIEDCRKAYVSSMENSIDISNTVIYFYPESACPANMFSQKSQAEVFNPNFPMSEEDYKENSYLYNLAGSYSDWEDYIKFLTGLYGSPYITRTVYTLYITKDDKTTTKNFNSVSEIEQTYNVEAYMEKTDNKTSQTENQSNQNKIENESTNSKNENNNITSSNNNNNNNNYTNNNTNSKPVKETIEMPYFQMGYELKEYTDDLDKLGIKYKIAKKSNLDYEDNTVINVEHNGENIEKGTTITITVADNVYDLNVRFDTYYLLELADISATAYENKTINVKVDVKGKNVFNGNLPLTYVDWADTAFTIKGKPDIRNDFEITVEGKKITKSIKTYYFHMYEHEIWVCKDFRIGS